MTRAAGMRRGERRGRGGRWCVGAGVVAALTLGGCYPDDWPPPDVFVDYNAHGRFPDGFVLDTGGGADAADDAAREAAADAADDAAADAARDAAVDAARDALADAALDGASDAGESDAGESDAGESDAAAE